MPPQGARHTYPLLGVNQSLALWARIFTTDSAKLGEVMQPGKDIYTLEFTNGGMISFGGGVVLTDEKGQCLGAVGVAGATVEADEEIAQLASKL